MKKTIVWTIAWLVLPIHLAFAAPAGSGDLGLRARLEQARAQKAVEFETSLQEAELMRDAFLRSSLEPLPVASIEPTSDKLPIESDASI